MFYPNIFDCIKIFLVRLLSAEMILGLDQLSRNLYLFIFLVFKTLSH